MERVKIKCTSCRNECTLEVQVENGKVLSVTGNGCRRGVAVAERKLSEGK